MQVPRIAVSGSSYGIAKPSISITVDFTAPTPTPIHTHNAPPEPLFRSVELWRLEESVPLGLRGVSLLLRADNLLDTQYEDATHFQAPGMALFAGVQIQR